MALMKIGKLAIVVMAAVSAPCFAYDCMSSQAYSDGVAAFKETNRANGAQLGVAVKYLQQKEGIGFDAALKEVMQHGASPEARALDDRLAALGAQIKAAKPQNDDECMALLQVQQQFGETGRQKIALIVKDVTGQDTSSNP
jgi:hypothetical protein